MLDPTLRAVLSQQSAYATWAAQQTAPPTVPLLDDWWRAPLAQRSVQELGKPYSGPVIGEPDSYRWGDPGWDCSSFVSGTSRDILGVGPPPYTDAAYNTLIETASPAPYDVVFYEYADPHQPGCRFPHMGYWLDEGHTLDCRYPAGVGYHPHLQTERRVCTLAPLAPIGGFRPVTLAPALEAADIDAVMRCWPPLLPALSRYGISDRPCAIAALGTARVETTRDLAPINEFGSDAYFEAMYGYTTPVGIQLGNIYPGDGALYHGRGWIQLTGRGNYISTGERIGVNLVGNPDAALDPPTAALIMADWFVAHGIPAAARAGDWVRVRRIINGGTNGLSDFLRYVGRLEALPPL